MSITPAGSLPAMNVKLLVSIGNRIKGTSKSVSTDVLDWWYVALVTTDVGSGIRQARQLRGWTQHELALAIGQHPNSISRWERGPVRPSVDVVAKISKATGVSADFLLGLTSETGLVQTETPP